MNPKSDTFPSYAVLNFKQIGFMDVNDAHLFAFHYLKGYSQPDTACIIASLAPSWQSVSWSLMIMVPKYLTLDDQSTKSSVIKQIVASCTSILQFGERSTNAKPRLWDGLKPFWFAEEKIRCTRNVESSSKFWGAYKPWLSQGPCPFKKTSPFTHLPRKILQP